MIKSRQKRNGKRCPNVIWRSVWWIFEWKEKFKQTKYLSLINDISALAPVKFITEIKKNDEEIILIFDEINNDLKKFELNQKIDNLEKKMIQNMNEETYKELLDLKRQANNG